MGVLLACSASAAAESRAAPAVGRCLPSGADKPLLDVKADFAKQRQPLKLRLLGFSRSGRVALLEQREGEETTGGLWLLRIVDLETDRVVAEQEFVTTASTTNSLCKGYGATLRRVLATHDIEAAPLPVLTAFPLDYDGDAIKVDVRRSAKDPNGMTRHEVWLTSAQGQKRVGVVRELDVESGKNPLGPPVMLGALRSPWEPRVAVLVRQDEIGIEAAVVPLVRVFGARLDSRWKPKP